MGRHQPLIPTISRVLKRLSNAHTAEEGASFFAESVLQTGVFDPAEELRDASISAYYRKGLLVDGIFGDPPEILQLRNGNVDADGSAASRAEAPQSAHYARSDQVSFNARSYELTTLAAENVRLLGKIGIKFIDGGTDSGNLRSKGRVKKC